jgi:ABC-type multidrug transport system ATPase subunit
MHDLLRRLPAEFGVTVFLSSYLLSEVEQIASDIGIIHEGPLLFQGTLSELQDEHRAQLTLGVNQPDEAIQCLTTAGCSVQARADGLLSVNATTPEDAVRINNLLISQRLEVFHLAQAQVSLEDIFLTLTGGKAAARRAA